MKKKKKKPKKPKKKQKKKQKNKTKKRKTKQKTNQSTQNISLSKTYNYEYEHERSFQSNSEDWFHEYSLQKDQFDSPSFFSSSRPSSFFFFLPFLFSFSLFSRLFGFPNKKGIPIFLRNKPPNYMDLH